MSTPATSTAVATTGPRNLTPAQQVQKSIMNTMANNKEQLRAALPRHFTPDRMIRLVATAFQTTPKLLECTPQSIMLAVVQSAQLGLEPGTPLQEAYLIPRNMKVNRNGNWVREMTATVMPGYRGMLKLARQSGQIKSVSARVVYERDDFKYELGTTEYIHHIPTLESDPGEMTFTYAVVHLKDGGVQFDVMSNGQMELHKARIKAMNGGKLDGPWVTDEAAMRCKTVLKRVLKLSPASIEFVRAAALDDGEAMDLPELHLDMSGLPDKPALVAGDETLRQLTDSMGTKAADTPVTPDAEPIAEVIDAQTGEVTALRKLEDGEEPTLDMLLDAAKRCTILNPNGTLTFNNTMAANLGVSAGKYKPTMLLEDASLAVAFYNTCRTHGASLSR